MTPTGQESSVKFLNRFSAWESNGVGQKKQILGTYWTGFPPRVGPVGLLFLPVVLKACMVPVPPEGHTIGEGSEQGSSGLAWTGEVGLFTYPGGQLPLRGSGPRSPRGDVCSLTQ